MQALPTPVPLVDLDVMEDNIARAAAYAKTHGIALRPHVKSHKSLYVARRQLAHGASGLSCATLHELAVMSTVCDDLLLAYPIVSVAHMTRLRPTLERASVTVAIDSTEAARALAQTASEARRRVGVLVEVDVGMERVGTPVIQDAVALASRIQEFQWLSFAGIMVYPGHLRRGVTAQAAGLEALRKTVPQMLEAVHRAGLPTRVVSAGGTPIYAAFHTVPGVTEMRIGTYAFNDRATVVSGACTREQCAVTIAATVVSTAVTGQAVVDAGTKALGREPMPDGSAGFAEVHEHPEVLVTRLSEEHGVLDLTSSSWRPKIGDTVHLIPNHVCIAMHLNDYVIGVRQGVPRCQWPLEARGRGNAPFDLEC